MLYFCFIIVFKQMFKKMFKCAKEFNLTMKSDLLIKSFS